MKLLVVTAVFVAASSGFLIPETHYVEGESRYIWMSDDKGVPHLVDLQEPVDDLINEQTRSGANNQYWLFTRSNPTTAQILVHGNANSVSNSNYVASRQLKVIVHGWNGSGNSGINPDVTAAYLDNIDANVIVVDWRAVANQNYVSAVSGVPSVGQHLGNFLVWLINTAGGNWNNVHLIGFSLGAHVVGNAGRAASARASRITGLDPAGPLWWTNSNRLMSSDGIYVEAIHTDGGLQGIFDPIADADFYPNGGRNPQPGCANSACSHGRAVQLFTSSVRTDRFVGRRCVDLNQAQNNACTGATLNMGNRVITKRGTGLYALSTGASWPF